MFRTLDAEEDAQRARACRALLDAGGVTEISRWWSERSEREPPDQRPTRMRPGGALECRVHQGSAAPAGADVF